MSVRIPEYLKRGQFVLLTAVATYLSLTPQPGAVFEASPDKVLHLVCWMVLTVSLRIALGERRFGGFSVLALFGFSVLVEWGQDWVPGRDFSGLDILANGLGVALGCGVVWTWRRWRAFSPFAERD